MRILVTGGAGMVGSHAAEYWASRGHEVTVLDNLMRSALFGSQRESVEYNWRYLEERGLARLVRGDVRSPADVRQAIGDGVDAVLHAAGQPGVGYSLQYPREDFSINAQGTLELLEAVRERCPNATVLYCSTNKVYGTNVDAIPLSERERRYVFADGRAGVSEALSVDHAGHTPYGVSKLAGELYMQDYAYSYGVRTGIFRMSCIYGTRQFGFEDQGWVAHFAISSVLGRPVTIYGDGKQVRDVLFVEDLVRAFDAFLGSTIRHAVFNIGGGPSQTTSLLELIDALERLTGRALTVRYDAWRSSDQRVYVSDISRVAQALGWQPRVGVPAGLQQLLTWIQERRELFADEPAVA